MATLNVLLEQPFGERFVFLLFRSIKRALTNTSDTKIVHYDRRYMYTELDANSNAILTV